MSTSNNVNSKLDFYKKIKTKFSLKQYLLVIKNGDKSPYIIENVTRFRISADKFPVEIERYFKVPRGRVPFVTKELEMSSITSQNVAMSLSN